MSPSHPIGVVVEDNRGDIDISSGGMDEVISADRAGVTVSGKNDHVEVRLCQLDACRKGKSATVGRVQGVKIQIARCPGGASDP